MNIVDWLRRLDSAQYIEAFAGNAIDWSVLPSLTADDLKDIGVVAVWRAACN
jgi:SAM domain (Sterile alpha motif)